MIVYVDITQLEYVRANTGIQRVVKEFIKRAALSKTVTFKIISFDNKDKKAFILDNNEVGAFLEDMKDYKFTKEEKIDIVNFEPKKLSVFFDIDTTWNITHNKRAFIYDKLKSNNFLIFNFIYDLIPIILPQYAHENTARNFKGFIESIYKYSDLVMFDSLSAQNDFLKIKDAKNIDRETPTRVVGLGSDFLKIKFESQNRLVKSILEKKYILFVGTIEPRKKQPDVLEAFELLAQKYKDLNLVIIGKKGWKVDAFIQKILNHPLKNKQLFWLNDIDDNTLNQFYQNAFLVTYLSKYEGYGLPIAESLSYGNITVTSKNSSMYEVGRNFADYVLYDSLNELVSIISLYCDNRELYIEKKRYIKQNFNPTSWEQFYSSIEDIFNNYEKSLSFKQNHLSTFQFLFISIDKHNLEGTINAIDKYIDFVKEIIIITQPKLIDEFKSIKSSNKITIIDENIILGKHRDGFSKKDHQSKNWLLRASLLNLDTLEDEFIMLDDDNRPLKTITIDKFISKDGSYNAYYFYNLLEWHHSATAYDKGQQNTKELLSSKNHELLSYSSHSPQIINKKILQEVVDNFFDIGLQIPIDEWSIYFNYAVSLYPSAFNKKPYETLSWPANPTDWESHYPSREISFENYYKELYDIEFFHHSYTLQDKLRKHKEQISPYIKSKDMFKQSIDILSTNNMVHTICEFKTDEVEFYLSNIPYFVVLETDSDIKLHLNYKLLNHKQKELNISLVIFLDGGYRTIRELSEVNELLFQESIIEIPITSKNLKKGVYDASFNIMINNKYLYKEISPYRMKLIVVKDKQIFEVLGNPQLVELK